MIPLRTLGRTGSKVTMLGLGGEGALRTTGKPKDATAVIQKALELGITYFDTAPAYQDSRDYLGAVFGKMKQKREDIFVASKTHEYSYKGALALLDDTLKRLKTPYLDLWQLHDLRTKDDLAEIFSSRGAMEALLKAQKDGKVKYVGITGHHDPEILIKALNTVQFDTILLPVNASDPHYLPFITTVIPEARKKNMGVIGMKVFARGQLLGVISPKEALSYSWSKDVDVLVTGCNTANEVELNVKYAKEFQPLLKEELKRLEQRTHTSMEQGNYFKKGMD